MSERTENAAETTPVKEKKTLDYRIALALMIVMIIIALFNGASKAWKKNRVSVDTAYEAWLENVQQRVETGYNILTVAGRYLPDTDPGVASVKTDLANMQATTKEAALNNRFHASEAFIIDGKALLDALNSNAAVQADTRDHMYVSLMLPQALEQCGNTAAMTSYNTAAQAYNDGMKSFSGLLARLTGVDYAPILDIKAAAETVQQ